MPAIVKYSPWSLVRDIQEEMNQVFNRNLVESGSEGQWLPRTDIREMDDKYLVIVDIPGVSSKDIKITMKNNMLTIKGERKYEEKKEEKGYSRIERFSGNFYRQFTLPDNVDSNNIEANTKNGVLEITIPKKEKSAPASIEIKVNER